MIQVRDNRGNYHEALAIYDNAGREIKEVRNNQGRLLFKNWNEIHGSVPLSFMSRGAYLQDYRIYGNTVQNGTPTPKNPVEVRGCGEYDAELDGYKIPVTVSNGTNSITTPVYIGSEHLHKIGDYADYVDFKRGVVVRRLKKLVLTSEENWIYRTGTPSGIFFIEFAGAHFISNHALCTHYVNQDSGSFNDLADKHVLTRFALDGTKSYIGLRDSSFTSTRTSDLKEYLAAQYAAGTPVTIWYVLATPEEEPLGNLLPIQTIKGSDVLTVDTTVQPSEMYIKGKIKSIT